jgi:hypothetical protein
METDEMIVVPKETPIIEELNSYYLNIEKLFQYYQGIIDAGCAFFQLPSSEGVVFFDAFNLINGVFKDNTSLVRGKEAIDLLIEEAKSKKIMISIYEIPPERIAFWANVANAEDLYKDLSTEFTDLEGLIRKMMSDRLTGYVEVAFNSNDIALLFLHNGQVIGSVSAESKWQLVRTEKNQLDLVEKSRKIGAMLNVRRIVMEQIAMNGIAQGSVDSANQTRNNGNAVNSVSKPEAPSEPSEDPKPLNIREMLQYVMLIYDKFISNNRKIQGDFDTILKRKFVEKVDKYDFLDPFTAEFKYANGKIEFSGRVDDVRLTTGLIECLHEIAAENDMQKWLDKSLWPLREKYAREIDFLKIKI